jgi:hypothetical protein
MKAPRRFTSESGERIEPSIMNTQTIAADALECLPGLLLRPVQSLHELPVRFRWEVTRRHPYYLVFWESARAAYAGAAKDPWAERLGLVATQVLVAIGVTGCPPPPTASEDELGFRQLAQAWQDGAVAPVTYRGLAALLAALPRQSRMDLGANLLNSCMPIDPAANEDEDDADRRRELARQIMTAQDPALDGTPNRPIFGVNLYAPQKAIRGAVEHLLRGLKQREGIPELRRREDKLEKYLRVWDLREGWAGGGYDAGRELSFAQIAAKVRAPLATVANQYVSAFQLISGHAHTFTAWSRLFTVLKLFGPYGMACLRRRHVNDGPRRPGSLREVAEATLAGKAGAGGDGGLLAALAHGSDLQVGETLDDIQTLVRRGLDDNEIIKVLEPQNPEAMRQVIQYLRGHIVDAGGTGRATRSVNEKRRPRNA